MLCRMLRRKFMAADCAWRVRGMPKVCKQAKKFGTILALRFFWPDCIQKATHKNVDLVLKQALIRTWGGVRTTFNILFESAFNSASNGVFTIVLFRVLSIRRPLSPKVSFIEFWYPVLKIDRVYLVNGDVPGCEIWRKTLPYRTPFGSCSQIGIRKFQWWRFAGNLVDFLTKRVLTTRWLTRVTIQSHMLTLTTEP